MKNIKHFLDVINNLDESIKAHIGKFDMPNYFIIHLDKNKDINKEVNKLLNKIEKEIPKTFGSSIYYIISELTDNIEQHSHYSNAFILTKYNIKEKIMYIIIFDDGLSIPFVFEKNNISFSQDSEAIKMALEGKTTKKEDISRGFGLRTTNLVVKALNGEMKIISRGGLLSIKGSDINTINLGKEKLEGTFISIKLKTPEKALNIYPYLE